MKKLLRTMIHNYAINLLIHGRNSFCFLCGDKILKDYAFFVNFYKTRNLGYLDKSKITDFKIGIKNTNVIFKLNLLQLTYF